MRLSMESGRGSVAVELAILMPILCFLVIGGWVLGYVAYTKVALTMAANRAARDLAAATDLHGRLEQADDAYRYDMGFAESFGLPRWGVHGLAMKTPLEKGKDTSPSGHAVVVAVCYRVPFAVPFGVFERREPPPRLPDTSGLEDAALRYADVVEAREVEQFVRAAQREKTNLEQEVAAWYRLWQRGESLVEQGKEVWAKGEWAYGLGTELVKGSPADFTVYRPKVTPDRLEQTVSTLCAPPDQVKHESIVMTSRAAYLMQEVFMPDEGDGKKGAGQ